MHRIFIVFCLFFCATVVFAQIETTEVMYDLEGSDSGHEWIELHNTGVESVDLYNWRFFEADSNHKIYEEKGGDVIGSGSYVESNSYVILSNAVDVFMLDYPSYSGIVYYSSFSLHNTGEELTMRDAELNDIDSVIYSSEWGASGDGNSLQKINDSWEAGFPSPGEENSLSGYEIPPDVEDEEVEDDEEVVEYLFNNSVYEPAVEPKIIAYAGARERVSVVGARVIFKGDRKSTRLNSSHIPLSRMPSSA